MVPPTGCPATSVPGHFDRPASGHGVGPYPGAETLCDRFGTIEADLQCLSKAVLREVCLVNVLEGWEFGIPSDGVRRVLHH
jgi:hypothetical protein